MQNQTAPSINLGNISWRGTSNRCSGGGGSGGSIYISAGTFAGTTGAITANGGNGGPGTAGGFGGGGGGGGRVYVKCVTCSFTPTSSSLQAMGGNETGVNTAVGSAGSVYILNDKTNNGLTSDDDLTLGGNGTVSSALSVNTLTMQAVGNSGNATRDQGNVTVIGDITVSVGITVGAGVTLGMTGDHVLTTPTLTVNGTLALTAAGTTVSQPYSRVVVTTLTVNAGGVIQANGTGCPASQSYDASIPGCADEGSGATAGFGEGSDVSANSRGGGGGGYGGAGGKGYPTTTSAGGAGGDVYGSVDLTTIQLGSGGGNNTVGVGVAGGAGGGAMRLDVSGTLTVDGTISANGAAGATGTPAGCSSNRCSGGGGSGGSIYIAAGTLAGATGAITANGGNGGPGNGAFYGGGGGGGGRVYITAGSISLAFSSTNLQAMGGNGGASAAVGSAGTVFVFDTSIAGSPGLTMGGNLGVMTLLDNQDGNPSDGVQHYNYLQFQDVGTTGDARSQSIGSVTIGNSTIMNTSLSVTGVIALTIQGSLTTGTSLTAGGSLTVRGVSTVGTSLSIIGGGPVFQNAVTVGTTATISGGTATVTKGGMVVSGTNVSCGLISAALCVTGGTTTITGDLLLTGVGANLEMAGGSLLMVGNMTVPAAVQVDGGAILNLGNNVADSDFTAASLTVRDANSKLRVDSLKTAARISVTNLIVGPSTGDPTTEPRIESNGAGCGPAQAFNALLYSGCTGNIGAGGSSSTGGGGGGYGGSGGASGSGGGGTYGISAVPTELGSGGGNGSVAGGTGGGAVTIGVSGTLTLDGLITANGSDGSTDGAGAGGGGGSGGALYVVTNALAGSTAGARFQVNGGLGGGGGAYGGGGGGGGRAAIYYGSSTYAGTVSCNGGAHGTGSTADGADGTNGTCTATAIVAGQQPDGIIEGNGGSVYGSLHSGAGGQVTKMLDSSGTVSYSVIVKNAGSSADTFRVTSTAPGAGWSVSIMDTVTGAIYTAPFTTASIAAGASRTFTLKLTQPSPIPPDGTYNAIVDMLSLSSPGKVDSIKAVVVKSHARPDGMVDNNGFNLFGSLGSGAGGQSSRNVTAGVATAYSLSVQNDETGPDTFTLSWNTPSGWTVVVNDGTTDQISGFTTASIAAGGAAVYTLVVTPPLTEMFARTVIVDIGSTTDTYRVDSVKAIAVVPTTSDVSPPTITNVTATSITATSASIIWTTNESADSQVQYGTTAAYGSTTALLNAPASTNGVTSHSVPLSGLTANTTYHYRVLSRDTAGNLAVSGDQTFRYRVPSSAGSTVDASPYNVVISVGASTITVILKTNDGLPVSGKVVTLSSSRGGTDTIVQPASPTDVNGQTTGSVSSATTGAATISALDSTDLVAITDTASVNFTIGLKARYPMDLSEGKELALGDLGGVPNGNLKGLWHLNETAGATAADDSGNGNNGSAFVVGSWSRDSGNPVVVLGNGGVGEWDGINILYDTVINDSGTYKMWYGGYDGNYWRIGYATSADGITWTKNTTGSGCPTNQNGNKNSCVMDVGSGTDWDAGVIQGGGVFPDAVIKEGGVYKMWYAGYDGAAWRIGYATSADGITWTKNAGNACGVTTGNGCVLDVGTGSDWDASYVTALTVLKVGGTYKMWYTGSDGVNTRVGYATSSDGVAWTKNPGNTCGITTGNGCVMDIGQSGDFDDVYAYNPQVVLVNSQYLMFYSGYDTFWQIGYATSNDGVTWTKSFGNPVLTVGAAGLWDQSSVLSGAVLQEGNNYKMWYGGLSGGNWDGIGYATTQIWSTAGKFSNAISFNGADKMTVGSAGWPTNTFTVEAWVKAVNTHEIDPESTSGTGGTSGQHYVFGAQYAGGQVDDVNNSGMGVSVGTNGISVYEHAASYMPALAVYSGNLGTGWNHIAVVYNNKQPSIYLNGVLVHTGLTSPIATVYAPIEIGSGAYGGHQGFIDEVAIFNVALTPATILDHFRRGVAEDVTNNDPNLFEPNDGMTSGPVSVAGHTNQALSFDGVDDYIEVPANASLDPTAITIEAWIYRQTSAAIGTVVSKGFGNHEYRFQVTAAGNIQWITGDGVVDAAVVLTSAGTVPGTTWTHVAVTGNSSGHKIYINGVLDANVSATPYLAPATMDTLTIGTEDASPFFTSYFNGRIDEVRIYNRALTEPEIVSVMATPPPSDPSPPTDTTAPIISGVTATNVTGTTATISWATNEPADSQVEYGTSPCPCGTNTTLDPSLVASHSVTLSGLTPGTLYYYRAESRDASANSATPVGASFTTQADGTPPVISNVSVLSVTSTSAVITWTTDESADSQIDYGPAGYSNSTGLSDAPAGTNGVTSHNISVSGLLSDTIYHFRVRSQDAAGNLALSGDYTFSTAAVLLTFPAAPIACTGAGAPSAVCLAPSAISSTQIKVYWVDNSNNETGFRIERANRVGGGCNSGEVYSVIYTQLQNSTASAAVNKLMGYTNSGLMSNTGYCYRFQAYNTIGNSAYSSSVSLTTPAAVDITAPGTVVDLAVEPGNQTQNSIMLSWTAPSDDNTVSGVGRAGSYDLRYATSQIVDGGAGVGQVNFSAATSVSGVSAPKAAGNFETATVSSLTPNTIYYFALKSTNTIGTSAMSNLAGGDNTTNGSAAGRTALRTSLNMVSVPMQPGPADPISVFQDDIGGVPSLWSWRSITLGMVEGVDGCYDQYPGPSTAPCANVSTMVPGQGYFIQGGGNRPVIDLPIASTPVTVSTLCGQPNSYAIPLQLGWNMIGDPFPSKLTFSTVYVRQNGTTCADFGTAVTNGWVGNSLYDYNGSGYNFTLYSSAVLDPWKGYWLWVMNNNVINSNTYELIVPQPP
ncbi:MAG: fibronectin type III domain-containing protein [Nitrospirae bacterium]|nr:fibronectin type III domain-containing protein [Nitrospirota bacterium]